MIQIRGDIRVVTHNLKKLVGINASMSLANNRIKELWQNFMPRRKEIKHSIDSNLYSIEVYPSHYFESFSPNQKLVKWASIEVNDFEDIPSGMSTLIIKDTMYTVFTYQGLPEHFAETFSYILNDWLPASKHEPDNKPHFQIFK